SFLGMLTGAGQSGYPPSERLSALRDGRLARQVLFEDRPQLLGVIRLREEVVATGAQRPIALRGCRRGRYRNDRNALGPFILADLRDETPAVEPRDVQVEEDQVGPHRARNCQGGLAVSRGDRLVLFEPDDAEREVHARRIVLDDQDAGHTHFLKTPKVSR